MRAGNPKVVVGRLRAGSSTLGCGRSGLACDKRAQTLCISKILLCVGFTAKGYAGEGEV